VVVAGVGDRRYLMLKVFFFIGQGSFEPYVEFLYRALREYWVNFCKVMFSCLKINKMNLMCQH
jgi:hypothetical protein